MRILPAKNPTNNKNKEDKEDKDTSVQQTLAIIFAFIGVYGFAIKLLFL